jgi:hypothetical protein
MGIVLFIVVIGAGVVFFAMLFIRGAGPDWMWKGGRHDPIRNLLFRADGSWRRHAKAGLIAFWLLVATGACVYVYALNSHVA